MPNLNFLTLTIFLSDSCLFFTFVLFMLYFDDYIWFVMSVWREDYQQLSVMSHAFVFLFFKFCFLFYFTLLSFQIPFCPSLFSRSVIVQTITVTNDAFHLSHYPHLISLHAASLLCQFVFYSCSKLPAFLWVIAMQVFLILTFASAWSLLVSLASLTDLWVVHLCCNLVCQTLSVISQVWIDWDEGQHFQVCFIWGGSELLF